MLTTQQNHVTEWSLRSARDHEDPFNQITLDAIVTGPHGSEQRAPAFWSGGDLWSIRYASAEPGRYAWRTECSDAADSGLHAAQGELEITARADGAAASPAGAPQAAGAAGAPRAPGAGDGAAGAAAA